MVVPSSLVSVPPEEVADPTRARITPGLFSVTLSGTSAPKSMVYSCAGFTSVLPTGTRVKETVDEVGAVFGVQTHSSDVPAFQVSTPVVPFRLPREPVASSAPPAEQKKFWATP